MNSELIRPKLGERSVKVAGLISLSAESVIGDQLFLDKWRVAIVRPLNIQASVGNVPNRTLGLKESLFLDYCSDVESVLNSVKAEFSEVFFIDVRIQKGVNEDVAVNFLPTESSIFLEPVLSNYDFSFLKFVTNANSEFTLINKVVGLSKVVRAFQLCISSDLFSTDKGVHVFEEAIIFSHLSITGQLQKR